MRGRGALGAALRQDEAFPLRGSLSQPLAARDSRALDGYSIPPPGGGRISKISSAMS